MNSTGAINIPAEDKPPPEEAARLVEEATEMLHLTRGHTRLRRLKGSPSRYGTTSTTSSPSSQH